MRSSFVTLIKRNLRSIFLSAAAFISIGGMTLAVTSQQFIYSVPQHGSYSLSSLDLVPEGSGAAGNYFADQTVLAQANSSQRECFGTGVHLPQGAKLSDVVLFYNSSQANSIFLYLHRYSPPTNNQLFIVGSDVGNGNGIPSTVKVQVSTSVAPIDNVKFHYTFGVCLSNGAAMLGGRVDYTYTSAGD